MDTSEIFAERPGSIDETRLGSDGPFISAIIVYSFNDERPFTVGFVFTW